MWSLISLFQTELRFCGLHLVGVGKYQTLVLRSVPNLFTPKYPTRSVSMPFLRLQVKNIGAVFKILLNSELTVLNFKSPPLCALNRIPSEGSLHSFSLIEIS